MVHAFAIVYVASGLCLQSFLDSVQHQKCDCNNIYQKWTVRSNIQSQTFSFKSYGHDKYLNALHSSEEVLRGDVDLAEPKSDGSPKNSQLWYINSDQTVIPATDKMLSLSVLRGVGFLPPNQPRSEPGDRVALRMDLRKDKYELRHCDGNFTEPQAPIFPRDLADFDEQNSDSVLDSITNVKMEYM